MATVWIMEGGSGKFAVFTHQAKRDLPQPLAAGYLPRGLRGEEYRRALVSFLEQSLAKPRPVQAGLGGGSFFRQEIPDELYARLQR